MVLRSLLLLYASLTATAQNGAPPSTVVAPSPLMDAVPLSYELVAIHPSRSDEKGYDLNNRPSGITARAINLRQLLSEAYGFTFAALLQDQIVGMPKWGETQRFDMQAKVDDANIKRLAAARKAETMVVWVRSLIERKPTTETRMLQQLKGEYFHLKMHYEQRVMPVFDMNVAKDGIRMAVAHPKDPEHGSAGFNDGKLNGENVPIEFLTVLLAGTVGRPVINRTDLTGNYDFTMIYTPDEGTGGSPTTDNAPFIFTALDEQLGIKLVSAKEPVWVIVVDHVEMPADN